MRRLIVAAGLGDIALICASVTLTITGETGDVAGDQHHAIHIAESEAGWLGVYRSRRHRELQDRREECGLISTAECFSAEAAESEIAAEQE